MARPRTVSDEDILAAARAVFLEHGAQASASQIAQAVGLSGPALFKRFGTKEKLFVRAMAPANMPAWVLHCQAGPDDRPIRDQLQDIGEQIQGFFVMMLPRMATLHGSGCMDKAFDHFPVPPPVAAFSALTHWFEVAMETGRIRSTVDPRFAAQMFMGPIAHRQFTRTMLDTRAPDFGSDDDFLREMVDTLWLGLAPEGTR